MKTLTSTLLGLLIAIASFAQNPDSYQTIFGNNDMHLSGMGGFESYYSSLGGHFAYGGGGGGGVIINKKLILGGYGLGFTLDHDYTVNTITYEHLDVNHGGFLFGYTFHGNRPIHATTFLQLGWG